MNELGENTGEKRIHKTFLKMLGIRKSFGKLEFLEVMKREFFYVR